MVAGNRDGRDGNHDISRHWPHARRLSIVASQEMQGTNVARRGFCAGGVSRMPLWLEILINLIGYAGFIAIAVYHKPRNGDSPDHIQ
jgi:hypothetical protein